MYRPRIIPSLSVFRLLGIAALFASGSVYAGGFSLNEMSAASVGNAHAGGAALADDPSTVYYNPAGLSRLPGQQFTLVGSGIKPSAEFENNGSRSAVGTPVTGGNGGDAGSWAAVPAMYYSNHFSPQWSFGIGMQVPFGLKTEYDKGWAGRYQATLSDMKTIDINPAFAYQLNDMVSFGAGISAQYVNVELGRDIDFGAVCFGTFGAMAPAVCGGSGFLPQAKDGSVTVKGKDWSYGYNLGVLLTPTATSRIGLSYRSKISHTLTGDATFVKPAGLAAPLAAAPTFTDTGASAALDLPESLSLSGYTEFNPQWSAMADVTWMRWSRFNELRIHFGNGAADSVTPENWKDTTRVSAAVNYKFNDKLMLRSGIAYDPSPVTDAFRTARIPDADRKWLSFGGQFKMSPSDAIDIGYAHLFVNDTSINKSEPPVGGTLTGTYKNSVNIISVQYTKKF